MTQLILTFSDPKDANLIRKLLSKFEGVTVSKPRSSASANDFSPNATTLHAMKDARSGKTYKAASAHQLISDILY